jgi:hypothetical protein
MDSELLKVMITAGAAFAGALLAGWMTQRTSRKTLFVNTVTTERAAWRSDLRTQTAELVTLAHAALEKPTETLADFHERRVGIRLRVNPRGGRDHPLDQAIMESLAALPDLLRPASDPADRVSVLAQLERLEASVQQLLKQEWDKSKDEARTGKLQTARA